MSCTSEGLCGTGGWSGPLPGDPDNNSILTATPAFGGIDVTWTYPATNPHALQYTILYRSILPEFNSSLAFATVAGNFYYDKVRTGLRYYYWIEFVSVNGTHGEVIGPATALARPLIQDLIEELTGQIDNGVLAMSLKTEIARIQPIDDKIFQEIEDRLAANEALAAALEGVQLNLDDTTAYITSEATARAEGDSALVTSINTLFASAAGNAALIQEETTLRISADAVLASQMDTMAVNFTAEIQGAITSEATIRADADGVLVTQINAMGASTAANAAAALVSEQNLRVAADSALASNVTTLFSRVDAADAAVISEQTARSNADGALASDIAAVYATMPGQYNAAITAAVQTETTARVNADSALATDVTTLFSRVGTADAAILSESSARATAISAETSSRNTQFATVAGSISTAVAGEASARASAITAAVQTETNARVAADNALSSEITTAQTTLNGSIASVQTTLQTNINTTNGVVTNIGALYTAKVSVEGLIGGFGVYNDGTEVQAGFDVDMFWVGRTAANKRKPFIIVGSETFIDEAVINKLTFSKLRDESGSFIVENGKVKADYINARGLTVTSDTGVVGLQVDSAGNTTFGGTLNVKSAASGQRTEIDNNGVRVYDSTGTLRVRMGVW